MRTRRIRRDFLLAGVYIIRNETNGKNYVGSSADVIGRLRHHELLLMHGKHPIPEMQKDFDGNDHFSFDVLEVVLAGRKGKNRLSSTERRRLYAVEWARIKELRCMEEGYNKGRINEEAARRLAGMQ